jgi:NADH:ubiquinone oxidoreductase subunit 3 (subunit A)
VTSFAELSAASIVIIVAGLLSISALLISKISLLLPRRINHSDDDSSYECGFKNDDFNFIYLSDKSNLISLYLIIELALTWLLVCCAISVTQCFGLGKPSIRILAIVIMTLMMIAKRLMFKKDNSSLT